MFHILKNVTRPFFHFTQPHIIKSRIKLLKTNLEDKCAAVVLCQVRAKCLLKNLLPLVKMLHFRTEWQPTVSAFIIHQQSYHQDTDSTIKNYSLFLSMVPLEVCMSVIIENCSAIEEEDFNLLDDLIWFRNVKFCISNLCDITAMFPLL